MRPKLKPHKPGKRRNIWLGQDPDFLDKVAKMAKAGKTDKEIGKELGVLPGVVLRARHKRGIKRL